MRLPILRKTLYFLFSILFIDLFWMQVIKGPEYARQSENNRIRLISEEATRGIIYDRNGMPLVKNELAFDVVVLPQEISSKNKDALFLNLSKFLDVDSELLADTFNANFRTGFSSILLVSGVPRRTAFLIEQEMLQSSGIFIKTRAIRNYIYAEATAHILGYVGMMKEDEHPELKKYGYSIRGVIGRDGLEKSFDHILRGKPGGMQLEVDSQGNIIKVLSYRPPLRGKDIYTTIDIHLQKKIYQLVRNQKAAIAVMDANTGEILAMYSGPSYDPNVLVDRKKSEEIRKILMNKNAPLLNRNLNVYPPGSIFKIVTAYAGLAENIISTKEIFHCSGQFIIGNSIRNCWLKRGHGSVSLVDAIATSCNVFFWELGLKIGQSSLSTYAREFGLGKPTFVELPGERVGIVPNAQWKNSQLHQRWYGGDTVNFAIGQGYLQISPLQALKMVAFVANGGLEVSPHIVKKDNTLAKRKQKFSAEILRIIKKGMYRVVNSRYGTGRRASMEGVRLYAKTGTAQILKGISHAWFVGFVELKKRKVCFVVFLEHGGHGGEQAADIAKQIILCLEKS